LKSVWTIPIISSILILGIFGISQQAEAATVIISDQASCEAQGGALKANKCFFSGSLTIPSGDSWTSTMFLAVHDLTVEGELNAPNGMDADKLTNKGTITTVNLISIGPNNFWVNDCGGKINLLPNGIINFDAAGTNHGVIKGDSTTAITTPLSSKTVVNSGIIQSSITLNKVSIQDVSSPCPKDKKAIISESSTTQEQNKNLQIKETKNLRNCKENQICAFPGEYLRYRNTDSYDGFSEIAVVNFKEKISDRTIRVFVDGFGSKPLTYELNTKTGQEKNAQFGVDRPFNLVEPVPMYIGQKVFRIYVTFETTLTTEETGTFKNMERTFMVGAYEEEGLFVERKYDKETGVLVSQVENYELDGNWYKSESTLIDTNIFSVPTKIISTKETKSTMTNDHSGGSIISGEESCIALIKGAKWNPTSNSCVVKFLSIDSGATLTISSNVRLINSEGTFRNSGTINVLGEIDNFGTLENFGTINVSGNIGNNDSIINKGTIKINSGGFVVNFDTGTIDNFDAISNNDDLINFGTIDNHCDGVISGNPVGDGYKELEFTGKITRDSTCANLAKASNAENIFENFYLGLWLGGCVDNPGDDYKDILWKGSYLKYRLYWDQEDMHKNIDNRGTL